MKRENLLDEWVKNDASARPPNLILALCDLTFDLLHPGYSDTTGICKP